MTGLSPNTIRQSIEAKMERISDVESQLMAIENFAQELVLKTENSEDEDGDGKDYVHSYSCFNDFVHVSFMTIR